MSEALPASSGWELWPEYSGIEYDFLYRIVNKETGSAYEFRMAPKSKLRKEFKREDFKQLLQYLEDKLSRLSKKSFLSSLEYDEYILVEQLQSFVSTHLRDRQIYSKKSIVEHSDIREFPETWECLLAILYLPEGNQLRTQFLSWRRQKALIHRKEGQKPKGRFHGEITRESIEKRNRSLKPYHDYLRLRSQRTGKLRCYEICFDKQAQTIWLESRTHNILSFDLAAFQFLNNYFERLEIKKELSESDNAFIDKFQGYSMVINENKLTINTDLAELWVSLFEVCKNQPLYKKARNAYSKALSRAM